LIFLIIAVTSQSTTSTSYSYEEPVRTFNPVCSFLNNECIGVVRNIEYNCNWGKFSHLKEIQKEWNENFTIPALTNCGLWFPNEERNNEVTEVEEEIWTCEENVDSL